MDSRDLLILAGVVAVLWWLHKRKGACCASCAGAGAGKPAPSSPMPPAVPEGNQCRPYTWCPR